MSESALDPEELEAIQAAIRQSSPAPRGGFSSPEATPLALIAFDRDAISARPRLLAIATPWARQLERALKPHLGTKDAPDNVRVEVIGAEIIQGRVLRDELRATWRIAVKANGSDHAMVMAISGPMVEAGAARRCGATQLSVDATREPSPTAISLFGPVGQACAVALGRAFRERESLELAEVPAGAAIEALFNAEAVIAVTLTLAAPCAGRIKLFALPAGAAPRQAPTRRVAVAPRAATLALSGVMVELRAVLGTIEMSLADLRALTPGATFVLPTFVDSPVPIYIGGVLKAQGRPVVSRGVIAVEIESVTTDRGAST